jgi:hypothetical protein
MQGNATVVDRVGATPLATQTSERGLGVAQAENLQEVLRCLLSPKKLRKVGLLWHVLVPVLVQ